ncbi:MAG: hypothetical protein GXP62_07345 [Oligoflexia bacterium]|nr:hypothetical protein [Oligoflexia bacterium]
MKPSLLERLRVLKRDGSLPGSRLSKSMRRELRPLFDSCILEEQRSGAGRRVVVANTPGFHLWLADRLPNGLDPDLAGPPRAAAVASFRDAKVARRTDAEPVLLRVFTEEASVVVDGVKLSARDLTRQAGCMSFLLREGHHVVLNGRVGVVENLEAFLYAEQLGPPLDAAMYSAGRISSRMLEWMGMQEAACWIHLGDYDPVGISEYLRVAEACPGRVTLWTPPDLEQLVARYSKGRLMEASSRVWAKVRQSDDPVVCRVVALLDGHAKGLEHEILLRDKETR